MGGIREGAMGGGARAVDLFGLSLFCCWWLRIEAVDNDKKILSLIIILTTLVLLPMVDLR